MAVAYGLPARHACPRLGFARRQCRRVRGLPLVPAPRLAALPARRCWHVQETDAARRLEIALQVQARRAVLARAPHWSL